MAENRSGATESVDRLLESKLDSVDEAEELVVQMAEKAGFEEDDCTGLPCRCVSAW